MWIVNEGETGETSREIKAVSTLEGDDDPTDKDPVPESDRLGSGCGQAKF
jgi:hypothetical protein